MSNAVRDRALTEHAPAKVNLSLHVGPPKPNGRHDLHSLIMFADHRAADIVSLTAGNLEFDVTGPFAKETGAAADNLVWRAMLALKTTCPDLKLGAVSLTKSLPCAAGIGGGSADAGAILRLLSRISDAPERTFEQAKAIAPQLGGDVLACLYSQTGLMSGEGENYAPVSDLPSLPAILVNCGAPCPTGPVFRAYDAEAPEHIPSHPTIPHGMSRPAVISWLRANTENSLQNAAKTLVPQITETLNDLADLDGAKLVRMSGSGATCFALFETDAASEHAAAILSARHPNWWVRATTLGGDLECS